MWIHLLLFYLHFRLTQSRHFFSVLLFFEPLLLIYFRFVLLRWFRFFFFLLLLEFILLSYLFGWWTEKRWTQCSSETRWQSGNIHIRQSKITTKTPRPDFKWIWTFPVSKIWVGLRVFAATDESGGDSDRAALHFMTVRTCHIRHRHTAHTHTRDSTAYAFKWKEELIVELNSFQFSQWRTW